MKKIFACFLAALLCGCATTRPLSTGLPERSETIVLGISRILTLPFAIQQVGSTDTSMIAHVILQEGAPPHRLLLVPQKAGTVELLAIDDGARHTQKLSIRIVPATDTAALQDQKELDRKEGTPISDRELAVGVGKTLVVPFNIGPIFLSDPRVVQFFRVQERPDGVYRLVLRPLSAGLTDLMLYDEEGKIRMKYYLRVTAETAATANAVAAQKREESQLGMAVNELHLRGRNQELTVPYELGPVILTDPSVVSFQRLKVSPRESRFVLTPMKSGWTSLALRNSQGTEVVTYYIEVAGPVVASATPVEKPRAVRRQNAAFVPQVRFWDMIGDKPVPIY